jgi:sulfotransferase
MEKKEYFFLAGLPRSGNTLLSTILNQNPDIKVSANSYISELMFNLELFRHDQTFINFPDGKSLDNLISSVFDSYYKDWNAKYIIDRGPWGTQINLQILEKYLNSKIKIICPVRDIVEILASFVKQKSDVLDRIILDEINRGIRFNQTYKSELELKCEVLMSPNGQIEKDLFSLLNLIKDENKKYAYILEYKNLTKNPQKYINEIYDFLEIPRYDGHYFENLSQFSVNDIYYDDRMYGSDLHSVNRTVKSSKYKASDILPKNIIQKYSNIEFWRK